MCEWGCSDSLQIHEFFLFFFVQNIFKKMHIFGGIEIFEDIFGVTSKLDNFYGIFLKQLLFLF